MDVRGKAILKDGRKIVLELEPGVAPQPSTTPPHPDALVQEIADGKLLVHPSKAQITVRRASKCRFVTFSVDCGC